MGAAPGSMAGRLERGERNLSPGMSEKPRLASEAIEAVGVELKATENRADRAEIRADEARNRAILAEQAISGEQIRAEAAEIEERCTP